MTWFGPRFYNVVARTRTLNIRRLFAARSAFRLPCDQVHQDPREVLARFDGAVLFDAAPGPNDGAGCQAVNFVLVHSLLALSLLLWRWKTGEILGYGWGWQMYS